MTNWTSSGIIRMRSGRRNRKMAADMSARAIPSSLHLTRTAPISSPERAIAAPPLSPATRSARRPAARVEDDNLLPAPGDEERPDDAHLEARDEGIEARLGEPRGPRTQPRVA